MVFGRLRLSRRDGKTTSVLFLPVARKATPQNCAIEARPSQGSNDALWIPSLMSRIIELYSTIVACPNTAKECPNTINDPTTGNLPRGFYTQAENPEDVLLLLVAKNPGHPFKSEIEGLYRGVDAAAQVQRHFDLQRSLIYPSPELLAAHGPSLTFSKNLRRYMAYFLDMPQEQIFKRCAYTNLVKCTSIGEQDLLENKTIDECLTRHLLREIGFFANAKVVIAFGRDAWKTLTNRRIAAKHKKPVVYIKHPRTITAKTKESEILAQLKTTIASHLATEKPTNPQCQRGNDGGGVQPFPTDGQLAENLNLKRSALRKRIGKLPGSGLISGLCFLARPGISILRTGRTGAKL